jgi:hypothetical protein
MPTGKYVVAVTNVEIKRSNSEKNKGKPYYALQLTVQEGKYEDRKLFANVMLWAGAAYSLVQIHKAIGHPLNGTVVTPDALLGAKMIVSVKNIVDDYKVEKDGWTPEDGAKPRKNEVGSFFKYTGALPVAGQATSNGNSLLP